MSVIRREEEKNVPQFGPTAFTQFATGLEVALTTPGWMAKTIPTAGTSLLSLAFFDLVVLGLLTWVLNLGSSFGLLYGFLHGLASGSIESPTFEDVFNPLIFSSGYTQWMLSLTILFVEALSTFVLPLVILRIVHTLMAHDLVNIAKRTEQVICSNVGQVSTAWIFMANYDGLEALGPLLGDFLVGTLYGGIALLVCLILGTLFAAIPGVGFLGFFFMMIIYTSGMLGATSLRIPRAAANKLTAGQFGSTPREGYAVFGYGLGMLFLYCIPIFGPVFVPVGCVIGAQRLRIYVDYTDGQDSFSSSNAMENIQVQSSSSVAEGEGVVSEASVVLERQGWEREKEGLRKRITGVQEQLENERKKRQNDSEEKSREISDLRRQIRDLKSSATASAATVVAPTSSSPIFATQQSALDPFATQRPLFEEEEEEEEVDEDDLFSGLLEAPSSSSSRREQRQALLEAPARRTRPPPPQSRSRRNRNRRERRRRDDMLENMFSLSDDDDDDDEEEEWGEEEEEEIEFDDDDDDDDANLGSFANEFETEEFMSAQREILESIQREQKAEIDNDFAVQEEDLNITIPRDYDPSDDNFRDPTPREIEINSEKNHDVVFMAENGSKIILANYDFAHDRVPMQQIGVKAISQVCLGEPPYPNAFSYNVVPVGEYSANRLNSYLPTAVEFITSHLQPNEIQLVHCQHGRSRGASVIAAVLMKLYSWSPDKSIAFIRRRRPQVKPKPMFMDQLKLWYLQLQGKVTRTARRTNARQQQFQARRERRERAVEDVTHEHRKPYYVISSNSEGNKLYLSEYGFAQDSVAMSDLGIGAIVQVCHGTPTHAEDFEYFVIDVDQANAERVQEFFSESSMFIEDAMSQHSVLIHDVHGTSRCVAVAAAYYMKKNKITPDRALAFIKQQQPDACPADSYRTALLAYYKNRIVRRGRERALARTGRKSKKSTGNFNPGEFAEPTDEEVLANQHVNANVIYTDPSTGHKLILSNYHYAQDKVSMVTARIHAVVMAVVGQPTYPNDFTYHRVEVGDLSLADILSHFEKTSVFLEQELRRGNVLVHCQLGMSRGATLIAAFLMKRHEWSRDIAVRFVKNKRPMVKPNEGFLEQLGRWERMLVTGGNDDGFGFY